MPSNSYRRWTTTRARALDEIEQAHAAIGGTGPGRRYATQQVNQAYAVLLAAQFQGFCSNLHAECVNALVAGMSPSLRRMIQVEFSWNRHLARGNAQPGSLGADFGRFELAFWSAVETIDPRNSARKAALEELNAWRNAIAHQDFDPVRLGGTTILRLAQVRRWRSVCRRLARSFDEVMRQHLHSLLGLSPW